MIIKTLKEYFKDRKFIGSDLSCEYNQTYIEIPPFTKNEKGEWINDSAVSKWVKGDKLNVVEYVQSFRDSVDLSKIIDLVSKTGDTTLLNRRQGFYADITDIPQNQNDFNDKINNFIDVLSGIDKDIAKEVINGNMSNDEIYNLINTKYLQKSENKVEEKEVKKDE